MTSLEKLKYTKFVIFHPFDGFFEAKKYHKGSVKISTVLFIIYGIIGILSFQYTGFIVTINPLFEMNSISLFVTTLLPFILFIISNWSVITLCDGKGQLSDIYIVMGYSLIPLILFKFIGLLFSNIIILEEIPILNFFIVIGYIWFYYLAFCGLCTIHEYTVLENIKTLLFTVAAAIIIVFLCMLYYTLMSNIVHFITAFISELLRRW